MEAHPRTLRFVFRGGLRLVVPLFQRPYVWKRDDQWQPLWEDILAAERRSGSPEALPHFLGAIVLEHKPTSRGSLEIREVIDGQQRLTTLQLFIAALRDTLRGRDADDVMVKRLTKLVENDLDLIDTPAERHKLWPTNADRADYRAVMTGEHVSSRAVDEKRRIVGAYCWFRDAIQTKLSSLPPQAGSAFLHSLVGVVFDQLEIVVIDLGPNDNAQVIFETLNARGTELRAADLIKNYVFRTLESGGGPVEEHYERYWARFEKADWQHEVRQGRLLRSRLDAFMNYYLVVLLQQEVLAPRMFQAARTHIGSSQDNAVDFLHEAARYADVYSDLERRWSPVAEERRILDRLEIADTTTVTPLLLWLFANSSGPERTGALLALESYIVRRTICRLKAANYNNVFLEILRQLGTGVGPADDVVSNHLLKQGTDSGVWPSDREVRQSLQVQPLYRVLKKRLQRFLLALNEAAGTSRTETVSPSATLSVEHLMPQAWQQSWPLPADPGDASAEADRREARIHVLGNLTVVTRSLNSSISNGPWSRKRAELLTHSALTINRGLPEQWGPDAIDARGQWLAELAVQVWHRPDGAGADDLADDGDRETDAPERRGRAEPGTRGRRDLGAHIRHAFSDKAIGEFMTVTQIRNAWSPEYGDERPSGGAISIRLFPPNGTTTTLPGLSPGIRNGVRGATKAAHVDD